ncbi:MAG: hypothetical protein VX574_09195, partial [Myxococcota bacterium]|nr:hypothetical protein [Myxococcota bacterium]
MNSKPSRFFAALLAGSLVSAHAGAGESPTDDEQLLIYELNRARNDPPAWASETGLASENGGDGELATLQGVLPAPPLAVNEILVETARYRANDMATYNYFGPQSNDGRMPNEVVRDAGYDFPDELQTSTDTRILLADFTGIEGFYVLFDDPVEILKTLLKSEFEPNLYQRKLLLGIDDPAFAEFYPAFREVGAGYAFNGSADWDNYWVLHVGFQQDDVDALANFVTGVVFNDVNGNDRYDSGEGLSGVQVSVGAGGDVTNAAGGYAIEVEDGSHTVSCSGGSFAGNSAVNVNIEGKNVEVDFLSGESGGFVDFLFTVPEPGSGLLQAMALFSLLGLRRWRAHS